MNPIIAYENKAQLADTVTATAEDSNYPVENMTTWLPYEWYSPGSTGDQYITFTFNQSVDVDYFGVFSHNLGETGGTIKLQYHNGTSWEDLTDAMTGNNSLVLFRAFTMVSGTQYRVKLTLTQSDSKVGVVSFGQRLDMPIGLESGFELPHVKSKDKILNATSATGLLLGRSVLSRGNQSMFNFKIVPTTWVRSYWINFMEYAKEEPFFVAWDAENHADETVFCVTKGNMKAPRYSDATYMDISLDCDSWNTLRV